MVAYQLVVDCRDPEAQARFWAAALDYELETPPPDFARWEDWRRAAGFPADEVSGGADSIVDPRGAGPRIWFHAVPDAKIVKNRLHLDLHASTDGPYLASVRAVPLPLRRARVDAEAQRLVALGATITGPLTVEGMDHYAVGMMDPEGNEFDIN